MRESPVHRWLPPILVLAACLPIAGVSAQPVRLSLPVFEGKAEIEVRDLRRDLGEQAAREALDEMVAIEELTNPRGQQARGLGQLNGTAGQGPQMLDPRLADLLARALGFCFWNNGLHGPLGGELYRLWRENQQQQRGVDPAARRLAVESAACSHLRLRAGDPPSAELDAGSRIDLWGAAQAHAVDRALEVLRRHGAGNALVNLGSIWRAIGPGPDGEGWYVALPLETGVGAQPIDKIWLRDRSVAVSTAAGRAEGHLFLPFLNQRTGKPGEGVAAVVVVSDLAVDASSLATSLFLLGLRDGQRRLGSVIPAPAAYWLLGDGKGQTLGASYRWSEVAKVR